MSEHHPPRDRMNSGANGQASVEAEARRSPEQIQDDIRQTRSAMDETIDALADKFNPRHLVEDFTDNLTSHDAVRNAIEKVKQNPLPAALVGAGVAWMIYSDTRSQNPRVSRRASGHDSDYGTGWRDPAVHPTERQPYEVRSEQPNVEPLTEGDVEIIDVYFPEYRDYHELEAHSVLYDEHDDSEDAQNWRNRLADAKSRAADASAAALEKAKEGGHGVRNAVSAAAARVGDTISTAGEKVTGGASAVGHGISSGASAAADGVSRAASATGSGIASAASATGHGISSAASSTASAAQDGYAKARDAGAKGMEESPLAMGLGALGLGLIAGLLTPRTRFEDERMGELSDEVYDRGKSVAKDAAARAKHTAEATAAEALGQARAEGMEPSSIASKVGRVAKAASDAASEEARRQGMSPEQLKEMGRRVGEAAKETAKTETQREVDESEASKLAEQVST